MNGSMVLAKANQPLVTERIPLSAIFGMLFSINAVIHLLHPGIRNSTSRRLRYRGNDNVLPTSCQSIALVNDSGSSVPFTSSCKLIVVRLGEHSWERMVQTSSSSGLLRYTLSRLSAPEVDGEVMWRWLIVSDFRPVLCTRLTKTGC